MFRLHDDKQREYERWCEENAEALARDFAQLVALSKERPLTVEDLATFGDDYTDPNLPEDAS